MSVVRNDAGHTKGVDALDVGVGILLFFASHMVIRVMYYVGLDRTPVELSAFLVIVVMGIVAAHVLSKPLLRLRFASESGLSVPVVSVVAVVGAVLALVSMLPVAYDAVFYMAAMFLGLSCGWMGVIWVSSTSSSRLDAAAFRVDPSLAMAVLFYFLFRAVSTFSNAAAEGFLLAMPLVAIACMLHAFKKADGVGRLSSRMQALRVPAIVSAAFALAGGVAVEASGHGDVVLESGVNYMVFFEVLAVFLMLSCCEFMKRFSRYCRKGKAGPLVSFSIVYILMFVMGAAMGGMAIPAASPNALWESNVWVMLIAVFAYDIRDSLYAVKGLAVGLMFEAMCVGQVIARVATFEPVPFSAVAAVALSAMYLASVARGFFHSEPQFGQALCLNIPTEVAGGFDGGESGPEQGQDDGSLFPDENAARVVFEEHEEPRPLGTKGCAFDACWQEGASYDGLLDEEALPDNLVSRGSLAEKFGLTEREAEILELVAVGRSAQYIADELTISYNTVRTHIKHVYEKLNIHSKQELIDLVRFGS